MNSKRYITKLLKNLKNKEHRFYKKYREYAFKLKDLNCIEMMYMMILMDKIKQMEAIGSKAIEDYIATSLPVDIKTKFAIRKIVREEIRLALDEYIRFNKR